jgi:ATP/maltotriose-dependent transcriptional regulator MalT
MYLWLGMARLGKGDVESAWDALENVRATLEKGGMAFQSFWILLNTQMECELARNNFSNARELALRLAQKANEHNDLSYAARAHRILAEIAIKQGDDQSAAEYIAQAQASLQRCEAWNVEWRVHATAARVFTRLGRNAEAAESRERSRKAAQRVADTLTDEPELRESLLRRVSEELGEKSASA